MWDADDHGVLRLPSGRTVRGRSIKAELEPPDFGVYLLQERPDFSWDFDWIKCRDFSVPANFSSAVASLTRSYELCATERVEVGCAGGQGRTGTALACLAVLDGVPARDAVGYVRSNYRSRAVETPWQRLWIRRFARAVGK